MKRRVERNVLRSDSSGRADVTTVALEIVREAARQLLAEIGSVTNALYARRLAGTEGGVDRAERAERAAMEYRLDGLWERLRRVRFLGCEEVKA